MADEKRPPLGGDEPGKENANTGTGDGSVAKPGKDGTGTGGRESTAPQPAPRKG